MNRETYSGERVFHLDREHLQTLICPKLSLAGHLTILMTRTRGPFWSHRPARILWVAVLGTQIVATLIAVYGLFMAPLGWSWAMLVWGNALARCYECCDPVTLVDSCVHTIRIRRQKNSRKSGFQDLSHSYLRICCRRVKCRLFLFRRADHPEADVVDFLPPWVAQAEGAGCSEGPVCP